MARPGHSGEKRGVVENKITRCQHSRTHIHKDRGEEIGRAVAIGIPGNESILQTRVAQVGADGKKLDHAQVDAEAADVQLVDSKSVETRRDIGRSEREGHVDQHIGVDQGVNRTVILQVEVVRPGATRDGIAAAPRIDEIRPGAGTDVVISGGKERCEDDIVALQGSYDVATAATDDEVVATAKIDDIVAERAGAQGNAPEPRDQVRVVNRDNDVLQDQVIALVTR